MALDYRSDGFAFAWHLHPEVELTLIVEGRGQRYVGDSVEEFGPGDLVLLGANLPHTWHAPPSGEANCAAVVVQFLPQVIADVPELRGIHRMIRRAATGLLFGRATTDRAAEHLKSFNDLGAAERYIRLLSVLGQLAEAGDVRALSSQPFARKLGDEDVHAIDRVCQWVSEHLDRKIRQTDATALIHRSPSAFARFFKRMMGQTFVEYVVRLRVGRACGLLIETDWPITQISYASGFTNLSYFNRVFRTHRQMTPREYRKAFAATVGP